TATTWSRAWTASSRWTCTCRAARVRPTRSSMASSSFRSRSLISARRASAPRPPRRPTRVLTHTQARPLIQERLGLAASGEGPLLVVEAPPDQWLVLGRFAKAELGCGYLSFVSAVDWKEQGLEVVARVENLESGFALMMKCKLGAGETRCASLVPVCRGADWMQLECYDMFCVRFECHSDLRRILLPHYCAAHPHLKRYAGDT